jgi:hypothetical protein
VLDVARLSCAISTGMGVYACENLEAGEAVEKGEGENQSARKATRQHLSA